MTAAMICLAVAIYHESRGEILAGQMAVAKVIMHRVESPRWPNTVCGVIKQNKQFSFYADRTKPITDHEAYNVAEYVAQEAIADALPDLIGKATHYHTIDVNPSWAAKLTVQARIGRHVFYE